MNKTAKSLQDLIENFSRYTDPASGGYTRLSYTGPDLEARKYLIALLRQAGLKVYMDYVGNILGVRQNPEKYRKGTLVLSGSHLDTVKEGGRFDGVAGVAAAIKLQELLQEQGLPGREKSGVIVFAEEEGCRFGQLLLGSSWFAGKIGKEQLESLEDDKGVTFSDAVRELEELEPLLDGRREKFELIPRCYFELHIEQGPILEKENYPVGLVKKIAGQKLLEVSFSGQSGHAGTVPMPMRRDAFLGACEFSLQLSRHVKQLYPDRAVCTIGKFHLFPGASNVIPGRTVLTADIRSCDEGILQEISAAAQEIAGVAASQDCVDFEIIEKGGHRAVELDGELTVMLAEQLKERDHCFREMESGAAHDAVNMAVLCPAAMLFVPSHNGISHNPQEYTFPEDIAAGTKALAGAVTELIGGQ